MKAQAAKPVSIMKALSGTFAFVVLAVIAIVTLPSCSRKEDSGKVLTDKTFTLKIGKTPEDFVNVTNKDDFIEALRRCGERNIDIRFKVRDGGDIEKYPPLPHSAKTGIKTDKVTTSEMAQNAPAEESSAYDPNAVHRVTSNSKEDIMNVLDTLSPTPTPTR
jgi:hypothetical protein